MLAIGKGGLGKETLYPQPPFSETRAGGGGGITTKYPPADYTRPLIMGGEDLPRPLSLQ